MISGENVEVHGDRERDIWADVVVDDPFVRILYF